MSAHEIRGPGRKPALLAAAVLALTFVLLAVLVALGRADRADGALANLADADAPHVVETLALETTALGGVAGGAALLLVSTGFLWVQRRRRSILYLWTVFLGAGILAWGVKAGMDRPRPETEGWRVPSATYSSFSSGHATRGAALFAALALLIGRPLRGVQRALVFTAALLALLSVGASRVYLGVHYPTDVLGGMALGLAWAAACAAFLRPVESG
jgi:undecaprenyl-diphosphatase